MLSKLYSKNLNPTLEANNGKVWIHKIKFHRVIIMPSLKLYGGVYLTVLEKLSNGKDIKKAAITFAEC